MKLRKFSKIIGTYFEGVQWKTMRIHHKIVMDDEQERHNQQAKLGLNGNVTLSTLLLIRFKFPRNSALKRIDYC